MLTRAEEQAKVELLLKDAISNVCKTDLSYTSSMIIRALVVVIIDDNDTVTMTVNDVVNHFPMQHTDVNNLWIQPEQSHQSTPNIIHNIKNQTDESAILWSEFDNWQLQSPADFQPQPLKQTELSTVTDTNRDIEVPNLIPNQDLETSGVTMVTQQVEQEDGGRASWEKNCDQDETHSDQDPNECDEEYEAEEGEEKQSDAGDESGDAGWYADDNDTSFAREIPDLQLCRNGDLYKCPFCQFTTDRGSAMYGHMTIHTRQKLQCLYCSETFVRPSHLRNHTNGKHKMVCLYCGDQFTTRQLLIEHKQLIHRNRKRITRAEKPKYHTDCPHCDYSTKNSTALKSHMKKHIGLKVCCIYCNESLDSCELKDHILELHSNGNPRANVKRKPTKKKNLKKKSKLKKKDKLNSENNEVISVTDDKIHNTEACMEPIVDPCHSGIEQVINTEQSNIETKNVETETFCCKGCQFVFYSKSALDKHNQELKLGDFVCEKCNETFLCKNSRTDHQRIKHGMNKKLKVCQFCSRDFQNGQGIYEHRKAVHAREQAPSKQECHTCHICGKGFPCFRYLRQHMKNHDDVKPYQCPKCDRTFKYQPNFKYHKDSCLNESGFPCHVCGKTMKTEHTLKLHIRGIHSTAKHFPCSKCNKPFSLVHARKQHEKRCHFVGPTNLQPEQSVVGPMINQ